MSFSILTILMIIVIIVFIILAIVGTVTYYSDLENKSSTSGTIYFLMIGGYVISFVALVVLIIDQTVIQKRHKNKSINDSKNINEKNYSEGNYHNKNISVNKNNFYQPSNLDNIKKY